MKRAPSDAMLSFWTRVTSSHALLIPLPIQATLLSPTHLPNADYGYSPLPYRRLPCLRSHPHQWCASDTDGADAGRLQNTSRQTHYVSAQQRHSVYLRQHLGVSPPQLRGVSTHHGNIVGSTKRNAEDEESLRLGVRAWAMCGYYITAESETALASSVHIKNAIDMRQAT